MDEALAQLVRRFAETRAAEDATAAFAALVRASRWPDANRVALEALALGLSVDPIVDQLEPPSLASLEPIVQTEPGRTEDCRLSSVLAWSPDERFIFAVDRRPVRPETSKWVLLRWDLEAGRPEPLLRSDDLAAPDPASSFNPPEALAVDARGERLVFSCLVHGPRDSSLDSHRLWVIVDLESGAAEIGPLVRRTPIAGWCGDKVIGLETATNVIGPTAAVNALVSWTPGDAAAPERFAVGGVWKKGEVAAAPGTFVTWGGGWRADKHKLEFHRPFETEPYAKCQVEPAREVIAAHGSRAIVTIDDRMILHGTDGPIAQAPLPTFGESSERPGTVSPCPSGRVVATLCRRAGPQLRDRTIVLVDLRNGSTRLVHLANEPAGVAWSPSGRALAVAGQYLALQILDAGLGAGGHPVWFSGELGVANPDLKHGIDDSARGLTPDASPVPTVQLAPVIEALGRAIRDAQRSKLVTPEEAAERFGSVVPRIAWTAECVARWSDRPGGIFPAAGPGTRIHVLAATVGIDAIDDALARVASRTDAAVIASMLESFPAGNRNAARSVWRSVAFPVPTSDGVEALARAWIEVLGATIQGETAEESQRALDRVAPASDAVHCCKRCGGGSFTHTDLEEDPYGMRGWAKTCNGCGDSHESRELY